MENNGFCQRVIEAANTRPGKVAMTLIGPGGAETTFGEMLSQTRSVAYKLTQEHIAQSAMLVTLCYSIKCGFE